MQTIIKTRVVLVHMDLNEVVASFAADWRPDQYGHGVRAMDHLMKMWYARISMALSYLESRPDVMASAEWSLVDERDVPIAVVVPDTLPYGRKFTLSTSQGMLEQIRRNLCHFGIPGPWIGEPSPDEGPPVTERGGPEFTQLPDLDLLTRRLNAFFNRKSTLPN